MELISPNISAGGRRARGVRNLGDAPNGIPQIPSRPAPPIHSARRLGDCSAPKGGRSPKPLHPPHLTYEIASSGYNRNGRVWPLGLCSLPCLERLLRRLRDRA